MATNSSVSGEVKIESMEEYSEAQYNGNADYFYSSAKRFESVVSHTVFVFDKPRINRHVNADICAVSLGYLM